MFWASFARCLSVSLHSSRATLGRLQQDEHTRSHAMSAWSTQVPRHRHLCGVVSLFLFVFDEDNILGVSKFTCEEEARWRAKQWWGRNSHLRRCSVKSCLIYTSYDINNTCLRVF